jgi:hypothetical protein
MNWKIEAVEKLRRYDAMCRARENLPLELRRLEQEYTAIGAGMTDRIGTGSGNVRSREDWMLNNVMARQQLTWSLDQARSWTDLVERALSALSSNEQLILRRLYILPQSGALDQLCEELGMERSSVYRHRDKALSKYTLSLYGAQESN